LTADSVVESMKRVQNEIVEKEQLKQQPQRDREAQKDRRLKEKQQKDADREHRREEKRTRDAEHRRTVENRKRSHPIEDPSSMTDVDDEKENESKRYIDITINTSPCVHLRSM